MPRRRLFWRLYLSYLAVVLLLILAAELLVRRTLQGHVYETATKDLQERALLFLHLLEVSGERPPDEFCKSAGKGSRVRITLVAADGRVLGDSIVDPTDVENLGGRPEIIDALQGKMGKATRFSPTLGSDSLYLAYPTGDGRVLRTSVSLRHLEGTLSDLHAKVGLTALAAAVLAAGVSWILARRVARPMEEIRRGADRFAGGDLEYRLPEPDSEEMAHVARAMNAMVVQLRDRVETISRQNSEVEALLSSMNEGVVGVDLEGHVLAINRAARDLFETGPGPVTGKLLVEIVRNPDLQVFVHELLRRSAPDEAEWEMPETGRKIRAGGGALRDSSGKQIGALVVLNDVTRLRALENLRRDFVANVSHELRTPITSIKGFVETLRSGAMENPKEAERFLGIIGRHADRLNAIIEDLLTLSRIEQGAERQQIELQEGSVAEVIRSAVEDCDTKAREKNIPLSVECPADLTARINPPLLEQALVNLIDNAINYSEAGRPIHVKAGREAAGIRISVIDQGCGIPREHLPRLFERFYRVDRARSRKGGGTGLGLAIVKHIALAHGATVDVKSEPGAGSAFSLFLLP